MFDIWMENFEVKVEEVWKFVDDEKFCIWCVYLVGCVYVFEYDDVLIF